MRSKKGGFLSPLSKSGLSRARVSFIFLSFSFSVPPNIIDEDSSPSIVSVRENYNASLVCKAEGTPTPRIKWQREDKKPIIIKRKKKEGKRGA